jgi:serine/threonine protein kinase, bacterial
MSALLNNRYRILQTLGSGGCGKTFLAEDTHMPSGRRCVIKQLKPETTDPVAYQIIQERFQREAAILETLGRTNDQIPTFYAYFTEAKEFYLVQDWIDGKNLKQKVRDEGTLSEIEVKRLLVNLLPVLYYIHSQGIIHRDIKHENIMLREHDGKPVLIDFGAVKEVVATVVDSHGTPTSTIVIGTRGFMPLEQAAGRPVFASDLYSLGLTAIYSLTGKRPEELTEALTGEVAWRKYATNISPGLAAVLDKAIQPFPRERYLTAKEMLEGLQSIDDLSELTVLAKRRRHHSEGRPPAASPIPGSRTQPDNLVPKPIKQSGSRRFVLAVGLTGLLIVSLLTILILSSDKFKSTFSRTDDSSTVSRERVVEAIETNTPPPNRLANATARLEAVPYSYSKNVWAWKWPTRGSGYPNVRSLGFYDGLGFGGGMGWDGSYLIDSQGIQLVINNLKLPRGSEQTFVETWGQKDHWSDVGIGYYVELRGATFEDHSLSKFLLTFRTFLGDSPPPHIEKTISLLPIPEDDNSTIKLTGEWQGTYEYQGKAIPFVMRLMHEGNNVTGQAIEFAAQKKRFSIYGWTLPNGATLLKRYSDSPYAISWVASQITENSMQGSWYSGFDRGKWSAKWKKTFEGSVDDLPVSLN